MPLRRSFHFLFCAIALIAVRPAWSCSVPVFRYALEHWAADPFQVTVFHRGVLTEEQKAWVAALQSEAADGKANAVLRIINLDQATAAPPDVLALWQRQHTQTLPWLIVRFPSSSGISANAFSGPLRQESVTNLLDSPARREIRERLTDGQSAVWAFLDSGDKAKDDAVAALVEARLNYLTGVLALPKLDEQDIANGLVSIAEDELRLEFSLLRVSRHDPAEHAFVQMLVHTEPDLASVTEPMVFPVFGRGRALYALVGAGIRHETVDQAATFLIGKCSCQVKEQNPGVDLLLAANWEQVVKASPLLDRDLPTLAEISRAAPVMVTIEASQAAQTSPEPQSLWLWLIVGAIVGAAAIIWIRQRRRS